MYNDTIEHQLNNKDIIKDISEKYQSIMPQEKLEFKNGKCLVYKRVTSKKRKTHENDFLICTVT